MLFLCLIIFYVNAFNACEYSFCLFFTFMEHFYYGYLLVCVSTNYI